ncbi:TetR/AcrR family transcriptional regulator [Williamsia sp. 1135]|uniref:TetR/AcrR family transcriptional regulator n=1 Tax=Williamsia sp. 1135 TaxID=1889262 RepID=UPI000A10C0D4|nr:TetR/AcrR family transcriptional regulator [Williamsia sp. 1135]ORM37506.1 TetR family transcriptional regulator [Williamsia sp. 1135]
MASPRRLGAPDAKNRTVLLDATERLMVEQGYAAVSSRRVAEAAGLKPQLVHYYFRTMDELFSAVFARSAERGIEIHTLALRAPQPLWALWRFSIDPAVTALTMEFIALANHRKRLRTAIGHYAERLRVDAARVIEELLTRYGVDPEEISAVVAITLMTSVSRVLIVEKSLDMNAGQTETFEFVESYLRKLEGEPCIDELEALMSMPFPNHPA